MLKNIEEVNINKKITISVRSHIKLDDISDLLDTASRGASYWADCGKLGYSNVVNNILTRKADECIRDTEEEKNYTLNIHKIKRGLTLMAKKEPSHFANFLKGDFDQTTGDIFLQFCLLGEIVYS